MPKVKEFAPSKLQVVVDENMALHRELFAFKSNLSFLPLIRFWQELTLSDHPSEAAMAQTILREVEAVPGFMDTVVDPEIIKSYPKLVESLLSIVFPLGMKMEELGAAYVPYNPVTIYSTTGFETYVTNDAKKKFEFMRFDIQEMVKKQSMHAYASIVKKFYDYDVQVVTPPFINIPDQKTYLERFFQMQFSNRFMDIVLHGKLPKLSKKTLQHLKTNQSDLDLWEKHLPRKLFEFRGVTVAKYFDITKEQLMSQIKLKLLEKNVLTTTTKFRELQYLLQSLIGAPGLKLGVSIFEKNKGRLAQANAKIFHSFIQRFAEERMCSTTMGVVAKKLIEFKESIVIENLNNVEDDSPFKAMIMGEGVQSMILAPLMRGDDMMGLMELGAPEACILNQGVLNELEPLLPLFSLAIQQEYEEEGNRIRRIVKEEATAIHPSVEWRFDKAALEVIRKQNLGETAPRMEPIVFEDVYPLYAASDMRGSSEKRNKAIQDDLLETLEGITAVLETANEALKMPILSNKIFQTKRVIRKIKKEVGSGDELEIVEFMTREIQPLLEHIKETYPDLEPIIDAHQKTIDPKLGLVYKRRKDFEESMNVLNDSISAYLDIKEREAQEIFPHYFEKFKTDGVEYNIYVGQSILEEKTYDPMYLRNLRLWQLQTTAEIAQNTHALKAGLKVPLGTTHLILVHSNPMAIRFRTEEKQFDVDGAYNIRYEIVKKRIDKVHIRDTNERLTQPGMVAIVYSISHDADEYKEYIQYLQHEGLLEKGIEELDLEDLQGIKGLRALRVKVKM